MAVVLVGFATLGVLSLFLGATLQNVVKLGEAPWWAWVGGFFGALYIVAMLYGAQQVGPGVFVAVTVTAALVVSLLLDHFGWLEVKQHPAGIGRIVGAFLMIAGVGLIGKF